MKNSMLTKLSTNPFSPPFFGASLAIIALLWATIITAMATIGIFDVPADQPALPTLIAVTLPVIIFIAGVSISSKLRHIILQLDPVLLTEFQAWRIVGGLFLAVYAFGHLPGLFAWPAGLGDIAIGLAAPFMAWRLRSDKKFLTNRRFIIFNYLGLADFLIAIATGLAARNHITGLVEGVTSSTMGQLPLVLIPTLIVPAFIILHLIVLFQVYEHQKTS